MNGNETKNRWAAIPMKMLNKLAIIRMCDYQRRVVFIIWSETYGQKDFNSKETDPIKQHVKITSISSSKFATLTGIDSSNIRRSIRELESRKVIIITSGFPKQYSMNENLEKWDSPIKSSNARVRPDRSDDTRVQIDRSNDTRKTDDPHPEGGSNHTRANGQNLLEAKDLEEPLNIEININKESTTGSQAGRSQVSELKEHTRATIKKLSPEEYLVVIDKYFRSNTLLRIIPSLQVTYSDMNVKSELQKAHGWLITHIDLMQDRRCKFEKFIGSWLSKAKEDLIKTGNAKLETMVCTHCKSEDTMLIDAGKIDTHGCNKCNRQFKTKHRKA